MALVKKKYAVKTPVNEVIDYSRYVPFHRPVSLCEHTMITNDNLIPFTEWWVNPDKAPIPGFGASYRLIGDGAHTPTFSSRFIQSTGSGTYDNTLGVVNLVTFYFDGVDFWYSIVQNKNPLV